MVGLYQIDVRVPTYNGYEFINFTDGGRYPAALIAKVNCRCGTARQSFDPCAAAPQNVNETRSST